ncbi:MAG: hypothetical protein F6K31_21275 [Symploca sp. SIO2G7]|nr:hypothetical protein [Symploca sp. SIO2G7]
MILGIGLSLGLQVYRRDGVFFSGEAGLKALLAQQFSHGQLQASLHIPQPVWVQTLWRQGLYPFAPPYTYEQQGHYFIRFPFIFSALTAPFYAVMGYSGLYMVPLVSLWVIWWRFWQICRIWRIRSIVIALSLGLVILASPLTLYGAMYWEHTLAVALAFWGLSGLLFHIQSEASNHRISLNEAMVNGVCIGLSLWLRPEFFCLVLILGGVMAICFVPSGRLPGKWSVQVPQGLSRKVLIAFAGAMMATVLGVSWLNWVTYGHPLGIAALQAAVPKGQRLTQIANNYGHMVMSLLLYFPAIMIGLVMPWLLQGRARRAGLLLLWVGGLFAISVPLVVPAAVAAQQWGPRYYLVLVPMVGLIVAAGLQNLWQFKPKRWRALAIVSLVLVLGFYANIVNGGLQVYRDPLTNSVSLPSRHGPTAPAISALASHDERWVAMPQQRVAQQLWPSSRLKTFFRTETAASLEQLVVALVNQNESSFLYVCHTERPCSDLRPIKFKHSDENNDIIRVHVLFEALGTFSQYPFYRGLIKTIPVENTDPSVAEEVF